jgi:photosystem II stability/assembly factor-like uncharacterized protein
MHRLVIAVLLIGGVTLCTPDARAQQRARVPSNPGPLIAAYNAHLAMERSSPFRSLSWSFLGPTNQSGVAVDVAVADRGPHRRIYVAYQTGGLWKSDDNGATWQLVPTGAASPYMFAVAVAPSNPDIVWVGTHAGLYKSADAGGTWHYAGLGGARGDWIKYRHPGRIVIHPTDANIVYAAAEGPDDEDVTPRGVFRTMDGGKTWINVLYRNARTDASEIVMDPRDSKTLYVATWQDIYRKGSGLILRNLPEADTNRTSIWKTIDGGATWSEVASGLPAPRFRGRIDLDISRSNPNILYALLDSYELRAPAPKGQVVGNELYRSDDNGRAWRRVSQPDHLMVPPGGAAGPGFSQVRVDPKDPNTVYTLGVALQVSHDSSQHFHALAGPHEDHRGLWIDPNHPDVLYDCTDGGAYLSANGGATWTHTPVPTTQFYTVALDMATPFHAYGSAQDVNSFRGLVDLQHGRDAVQASAFERAPGGEATNHAIDPVETNIVYSTAFGGRGFLRTDLSGAARLAFIMPRVATGEPALRGRWVLPFILSQHDGKTLYAGYQYLFRSRDRGDHWDRISPDVTDHDSAKAAQPPYPVPAITVVAESPRRQGLIYVGTDDGHLEVTRDDGKTWTDLTTNLPLRYAVSALVASASADGTVYVAETYGGQDQAANLVDVVPNLFKSTDYGKTFVSLAGNLPSGPVNVIRDDPVDAHTLYVGTRLGVYVSINGGARWDVLGNNLPTVEVFDLQIHPRDQMIVIATFGHGLWVMDALKVRAHR